MIILFKITLILTFFIYPSLLFAQISKTSEDDNTVEMPHLTVWGQTEDVFQQSIHYSDFTVRSDPDTASLLNRSPGAQLLSNGPVSGQVQYRGMYGSRINVNADGIYINSGGPNWMDPPLHYTPAPILDTLKVNRGIASVSSGMETLGGTINAISFKSEFKESSKFESHGKIRLGARSVDESFSAGGIVTLSNERHRFHFIGSTESGDDREFANGKVTPTEFDRDHYGVGYGLNTEDHEFGFEYRRSKTGQSGNPSLPMDIQFLDTDIWRGEYIGDYGELNLKGIFYATKVDHQMDNFSLRQPPPAGAMFRFADAESEGTGYRFLASFPLSGGEFTIGSDGHYAENSMDIFNPNNNAFFVNNINNAERERYGVFAEWVADINEYLEFELGVRYNRVVMNTGHVDALPAQMLPPPGRLRDRFNNADRSQTDDNVDWVAITRYQVNDSIQMELGIARKSRSPYYLERYLWLPLEVTAGLADGNNHVGDINLDSEVSHQFEFGINWQKGTFFFTPRVFYQQVDDYIQGGPTDDPDLIRVSGLNGDPTPLQYSNFDAELYGFDTEFGVQFLDHWNFEGILSYVRGKREDIDDNLYRIMPLNGLLALTYQRKTWSATIEGVFAARQDKVSLTNGETETAGYGIANLRALWRPQKDVIVTIGLENIFDQTYRTHLGGFNRIQNSDIAVGARLPDPGRSFFTTLSYQW